MKLYWCPTTRSFSALWLLEETGQPYTRELIDIQSRAQDAPAFRSLNPMGKVPVLVDGPCVVSEQGAICAYVADRFPEVDLAPAPDDPLRGPYLKWLFFAGNCIEPAYMQQYLGFDAATAQAGWGSHGLVVDTLDAALQRGTWILGDRFSAADIMIGCGIWYGLISGLLEERPAFHDYRDRCMTRPAFRRASDIEREAD